MEKLGERAWKRVGMTRERTLRRLEQSMKQRMSKDDALTRRASLPVRVALRHSNSRTALHRDLVVLVLLVLH